MSLAQTIEPADLVTILRNRNSIRPEELARYRGKWVALSRDGSRVIAADSDFSALEDAVVALGEDPNVIPFDRVPDESSDEAIEFFDSTFRGAQQVVAIVPNSAFVGMADVCD